MTDDRVIVVSGVPWLALLFFVVVLPLWLNRGLI